MKKRNFIFLGIVLIILALFTSTLKASPIDLINVNFEKETYSTVYGSSLKINYTIENNNPENKNLLVYVSCDEDILSCNFSKTFNLNNNSSITSSFTIKGIDDGSSNLKFYVKDMKTNDIREYLLRITVDRYNDDGRFEVDISQYSFCRNRTEEARIIFDRVNQNDFYNLSLSSNTIIANIKGSNYRFLKADTEIPIHVDTKNLSEGPHTLTLNILNDDISVKKVFSVYVFDCPDIVIPDFTVTGVQSLTHVIKKEEPYSLTFVVKNVSLKNKHIFISQESDEVLDVTFSNRELRLSPNQSKEVTITFLASKETKSGDYLIKLSFFDEKTTITRNLRFLLQPESNLNVRLLQPSLLLEIGKISELGIIIENKGDIQETVYLDLFLSNDLKVNNMVNSVVVAPYTTRIISLKIYAGENTIEKTSQIDLELKNSLNDYHKKYKIDVTAFRARDIFKISFLSFPNEISLGLNSSKDFSFEVYNFDDKDIIISKIDITGLPQEISYEINQYTYIPKGQSRVISGKFIVGEMPLDKYSANIIFYSNSGAVISKPIIINITDEIIDYEDDLDKKPITGFFTLSQSIFLGIIILCLLLIVLFVTGVIKTKHKNYGKNKSVN